MPSTDWNRLDPGLLSMMKVALGAEFDDFARACEQIGILRQNFWPIDETACKSSKLQDPQFALSMCASATVSAANHYGGQGQLDVAQQLAVWAFRLEPSHVPALLCLRTIAEARADSAAVEEHQKAAEAILQRIQSAPEETLSTFERGLLNIT